MLISCEEYYKQLHANCGHVLAESFSADVAGLHAASHSFASDLEKWHGVLSIRPESVLIKAALFEYQFSLLAVIQGQYRQAFMALRLSFEMLLAAVYLSANELKLRYWIRGEEDIVWNALIDQETGVLSRRFVKAFWEELAEEAPHYRAMGQAVYRECSEYVHGNAITQTAIGGQVLFQQAVFQDWHEKAKTIRLVSSFAICARYVRLMDGTNRAELEGLLMDNLGHIPAVRSVLGAPTEQARG